jgi:hypothetical protein
MGRPPPFISIVITLYNLSQQTQNVSQLKISFEYQTIWNLNCGGFRSEVATLNPHDLAELYGQGEFR